MLPAAGLPFFPGQRRTAIIPIVKMPPGRSTCLTGNRGNPFPTFAEGEMPSRKPDLFDGGAPFNGLIKIKFPC